MRTRRWPEGHQGPSPKFNGTRDNLTLASEQVVIAAPMSFAGSAQRLAKLPVSVASPPLRAAVWALTVVLIIMVWMFVLTWYLTWGLLLVPYRIMRRGQRKQKVERLRHREMIERLDQRR
jgi:hypothetical protein